MSAEIWSWIGLMVFVASMLGAIYCCCRLLISLTEARIQLRQIREEHEARLQRIKEAMKNRRS